MKVDLNADLGESFGVYHYGADEELLALVTSANIACGWHGGDPCVMRHAVRVAKEKNVSIGAHPGYPDRMGFGRREMKLSYQEVVDGVLYQLGALDGICRAEGTKIDYVKPHGALYNAGNRDGKIAEAIVEAVQAYDPALVLLCPAYGKLPEAAERIGVSTAAEFFADRAYCADGSLLSRSQPKAVIEDPKAVCERVLFAVQENTVLSIEGKRIAVRADSICLHGDNPAAVFLACKIKEELENAGIELGSFVEGERK